MITFETLKINSNLITKMNGQGIKLPTEIQGLTIPIILNGEDLLAQSHTGTGKTLAFLLPLIHALSQDVFTPQVLILAPTRELAKQVTEVTEWLLSDSSHQVLAIYGGVDLQKQLKKLSRGVSIIVATPGRLIDHIQNHQLDLSKLKTVVLDEADQMLLLGFKNEVEQILKPLPSPIQMLCFSATLDYSVKKLAYRYMDNPKEMRADDTKKPMEYIEQMIVKTSDRWKQAALLEKLDQTNPFLGIIFCRTIRRVVKLETDLSQKGYNCAMLHGDMTQSARSRVLKTFKEAKIQFLVTTDLAARGLDITGITHIFNFDIPETTDVYIHRIGRTGRMGKDGIAITFVSPKDEALLNEIESLIKQKLTTETYSKPENHIDTTHQR